MKASVNYDLTYISIGLGRQSTALAICSALGLHGVPKATDAIFADTGDELPDTYKNLEYMTKWLGDRGMRLHVVKQGNLGAELLGKETKAREGYIVSIPAFTEGVGGSKGGMLRRQCTQEYKLEPIKRKVRELLGFQKGERIAGKKKARALIGISRDEIIRVKPSRDAWIENCYPLVDANLRVQHCEAICREHVGFTPVKSACVFCPYHDNTYWRWLKKERPESFEAACKVDDGIRDMSRAGVERPVFLHRSLVPLRAVDVSSEEDRGQKNMFGNECEGMCGV